jgi:hypothetical protein
MWLPVGHCGPEFSCFDTPRITESALSKTPTLPERELEKSWLAINMFM